MEKNTGLIVLVVILSLLVIGLGGFIVYDKVLSTDNKTTDNGNEENSNSDCGISEIYNFNSMSGYYYTDVLDNDTNDEYIFAIFLLENGIFKILLPTMAPYGYIGNYTINNDVITLNYWFSYNSGVGKNFVNKTESIKIASLNTLKIDYGVYGLKTYTLEKDNNANTYDFYNDLKNNFLDGTIFVLE